MKKSQIEMIGLVIVLIIISLVALFVVKYMLIKDDTDIVKDNTMDIQASNMINALLKTNPDSTCKKNLGELIASCCDGVPVCNKDCNYIIIETSKILSKSNLKYEFKVLSNGNVCGGIEIKSPSTLNLATDCTDVIPASAYPIIGASTYETSLSLCKL